MHGLIDLFAGSSMEIDEIMSAYGGKRTPVIETLELLSEMLKGDQAANGALFTARNTAVHNEDGNLGALMLAYWAKAITTLIRTAPEKALEARAVIHRAKTITTADTPKEIQSLIELTEARITEAEGNITERDSIMQRALKKITPASPRYPWMVGQYSLMLACSGRLSELSRRISAIETSSAWPQVASYITLANFVNHVETCNVHQAEQLLPAVIRPSFHRLESQTLDTYRALLPLLTSALSTSPHSSAGSNPAEDITPDWALTIRSLTSGNAHQALKWARISEKRDPVCLTGSNFISTNLIRAELAEGNVDAAKRLISMRRTRGNLHYLDSLLDSRCLLLEGAMEPSSDLFCTAAADALAHNAGHRLELEMTLAAEIPNHLVMQLMQKLAKTSKPKEKPTPTALPAKQTLPAAGLNSIIGTSKSTEELKRTISHFARLDVPVMITGETGTGKDLVARAIHEESTRRNEPFIAVNCASISESLLESELFGHEKGAFTGAATARKGLFEEAGSGSIFLDEIGEITPRLQASLLRVLESGEIRPVGSSAPRATSCRIITATNANLSKMANEGRFRNDVLFRLKRLEIHIPPLRERNEDILPLASCFLNLNRIGDTNAVLSENLCRLILSYPWPGNVRELRNTIERMRLMNSDKLYYEIEDIGLPGAVHHHRQIPVKITRPIQDGSAGTPRPTNLMDISHGRAKPPAEPSISRQAPKGLPPQEGAAIIFRTGKSRMRRIEALKEMFKEYSILTRSEIIEALRVSPNAATSDLQDLVTEGYIDRIQPSKSPRSAYFKIRIEHQPE